MQGNTDIFFSGGVGKLTVEQDIHDAIAESAAMQNVILIAHFSFTLDMQAGLTDTHYLERNVLVVWLDN